MKKKGTRKKGRSIFLRLVLVAFLCYGVASFVMLQSELAEKDQQLEKMNQKKAAQEQINEELEILLGEEHYNEYIARVAREKLNYVYPDERVFVDVSGS